MYKGYGIWYNTLVYGFMVMIVMGKITLNYNSKRRAIASSRSQRIMEAIKFNNVLGLNSISLPGAISCLNL